MDTKTFQEIEERSAARFRSGFNCSETTYMAGAEMIGKTVEPSAMTAFGGGICQQNLLCGALTGSLAAIGLFYGRTEGSDKETKLRVYESAGKFVQEFREKFGSVNCTDLCGCDLSTAEGKEVFFGEDRHNGVCAGIVQGTLDMLKEKLRQGP